MPFFNSKNYFPVDAERYAHNLRRQGLGLFVRGFYKRDWAICFIRILPHRSDQHRWGEEQMERKDYTCSECGCRHTVEFPSRRREPHWPLPIGWVRVRKLVDDARGETIKTYCAYCVTAFGPRPATERETVR